MNYASADAINRSFTVTNDGQIACDLAKKLVKNSMQRAYIFTNLFFYDITEREVNKLRAKIQKTYEVVIGSSEFAPDDVDHLFPNISARFATEVGNNSLDPLIKLELAKVKPTMMLQLSKAEQKQIDQMNLSICNTEINKFKKALIITQDNKGKPYVITLSEKYVNNLPERCRRFLKPTIKMLAYMDGLKFDQFEITPDYKITYTWSPDRADFNEEELKDQIKAIMAGRDENAGTPSF
ncbi:MAG: hypothetical protein KIG16_02955 [Eubacteriales bacterium]|nr:hypothetical protein [Eubacteriales bacterium]